MAKTEQSNNQLPTFLKIYSTTAVCGMNFYKDKYKKYKHLWEK